MAKVVLSSPLLLEPGKYEMEEVKLAEAKAFAAEDTENFCGHQTVKLLGLNPEQARKVCKGYDQALCISPDDRLEYGREYSVEEIEEIGYKIYLVTKVE